VSHLLCSIIQNRLLTDIVHEDVVEGNVMEFAKESVISTSKNDDIVLVQLLHCMRTPRKWSFPSRF